jgi:GT2 family glycosyltransferase
MDISISIIIPTHDRCSLLLCVLEALSNQTADPKSYEVIVVADGCQDNTVAAVKKFPASYRLTLIEQASSGPARARNQGAKEASAPLLMFLDDDIEPSTDLVESHLKAHQKCPDLVVLGYVPLKDFDPQENRLNSLEVIHRLWWSVHFSNKLHNAHRVNFCDIITGNVSMRTELFRKICGFDEKFLGTYEDYELGLRLLEQRPQFHLLSRATGFHHAGINQERALRRQFFTGQYHVLMIQRHPELSKIFPVGYGPAFDTLCKSKFSVARRDIPKFLFRLIWSYPTFAEQFASGLNLILYFTRKAKIDKWYRRFLGLAQNYSYWRGVREEIGSLNALDKLNSLVELPQNFNDIEIDVHEDLKHLDNILAAKQIDAMSLKFGEVHIGRIDPMTGVEPLRTPHVYEALINCFDEKLMEAINPEINDLKLDQDMHQVSVAHGLILLAKLSNKYRQKLILLGSGWHLAENWDGIPIRWMKERAKLLYYSETECYANLKFQTFSFYRPRTLEIYANNKLISRWNVPQEFIWITAQINLNNGVNIFSFNLLEECERPCDYPGFDKNDTRCLGLAIKSLILLHEIE